jgi:hypothetical protein
MPHTTRRLACLPLLLSIGACAAESFDDGDDGRSDLGASGGLIDCFPEGAMLGDKPVACETSAVVIDVDRVLIAADKPVPAGDGGTAVFSLGLSEVLSGQPGAPRYVRAPAITRAQKLEALTTTPDGAFTIASSAFDRASSSDDNRDLDHYNTILVWPAGQPDQATVATLEGTPVGPSSIAVRKAISAALGGAAYFKVEGIAAITAADGRDLVLFGVREVGETFEKFEYTVRIVAATYAIAIADDQATMTLGHDFHVVYDLDQSRARQLAGVAGDTGVGLSDLAWDQLGQRLLLLTSQEVPTDDPAEQGNLLGGDVWSLAIADVLAGYAPEPSLVFERGFVHKAEGMTLLQDGRLLDVHDDDRVVERTAPPAWKRASHQAAFEIISLDR